MVSPKILVVEDEKLLAVDIRNSLNRLGYTVSEITNSGEEAIKKVAEIHPNLVLIDICLSGEFNGVKVAEIIQNNFHIPVLYLTDYSEYKNLHQYYHLREPFSYVLKPFIEKDLHIAVEMALYKHHIKSTSEQEKYSLLAILNHMGSAVVVTDTYGRVQLMNSVAEIITGLRKEEVSGKYIQEVLNIVDKDSGETIANLIFQVMETGTTLPLPDKFTLITKNGGEIPIADNISPVRDEYGNITGTVLVFQDVTERRQIEAQLTRNAFYDGLTALPNRILFLDRLRQALERCKRRLNFHFAVLFLDLDGFKGINDRFGHGMGDDFLVAIARRLESCIRSGDTVARFGGDEFAILLEDIKDVSDATNVAKRIRESLSLPLQLNGYKILTTASIGIALSGNGYEEAGALLRDADSAMYRAKEIGKDGYIIFDPELMES
ncbi:GGDEF domain-containing response regulator [Calothrix sp. 336/3]|uniref:GGDEF domain-containing response regulator n=1 Tax=Calothrix sp. 336/3 TaxID=1337936 RepID=UPI0004E43384|nr:diguanylate cyclase [Calothrix sp. 336/3]AKG23844.1 diguanylate cyclase [Calothrix sp. 336/3]